MKKLIILLIVMASALAGSVGANAQFRYGATAGVTINDMVFKQDLVPVSQAVGYTAGVIGEMMFPGIGFGMDLGVFYNQQGAKVDLGSRKVWASEGWGNEHVMFHTIQIPVHFRFKYTRLGGLEETIAPFVYGGPDFSLQVGHSNAGAFKCSGGDLGLTAGVGAELFTRWQLSGSYTWGMTYLGKTKLLDDFSCRSRQWTIRLTYFF